MPLSTLLSLHPHPSPLCIRIRNALRLNVCCCLDRCFCNARVPFCSCSHTSSPAEIINPVSSAFTKKWFKVHRNRNRGKRRLSFAQVVITCAVRYLRLRTRKGQEDTDREGFSVSLMRTDSCSRTNLARTSRKQAQSVMRRASPCIYPHPGEWRCTWCSMPPPPPRRGGKGCRMSPRSIQRLDGLVRSAG